jgi:hypothetical protein
VTDPTRPDLPRHDFSGRHYLKSCLIVGLGILIFICALIAFFTYLAHHNPKPAWS